MARRSRESAPPRRRWRRRILMFGFGVPALLFFIGITGVYLFAKVPDAFDIATVESARVVDTEGRFVSRLAAEADRVRVEYDEIPKHLVNAVVSVEDHRFWSHKGVSPLAIGRAAAMTVLGKSRQGGSTITQQFVKNAYVGNERSLWRKVKEAVLSIKLERQRSKEEILTDYLNTIYLGRGTYGVQAASKAYFGHGVSELTIAESALIAGIIRSPETYEPTREPELARNRRDVAVNLMVENGYLDAEKAQKIKDQRLSVRPRRLSGIAPHLLDEVRQEAQEIIGTNQLYGGGVEIRLTMDRTQQVAALSAAGSVYDQVDDPEVAVVAIDPETGGVTAMVGARDYSRRQLNLALARRQPGSTFKTAVLVEALAQGVSSQDLFPAPARRVFDLPDGPWPVNTYDNRGHGTVTLARATELSINTTYAKLILQIGAGDVAATAKAMGISRDLPDVPSLALGTLEVTPLELASMYATIAAGGVWREPHVIERITDSDGKLLYRHDPTERRAIDEDVAAHAAWVLKGVIDNGTGAGARIGRDAAGKTGTTEDFRDAWFAGFTPDLAAVVWNGYAQGGRFLRGVHGRDVTGGSFPAQIWREFMVDAHEGVPASRIEPFYPTQPDPTPTKKQTKTPTPEPSSTETVSPTLTPKPTLTSIDPSPSDSKPGTPKPSESAS